MIKSLSAGALAFCLCATVFFGGMLVGASSTRVSKSSLDEVVMSATRFRWNCRDGELPQELCVYMSQTPAPSNTTIAMCIPIDEHGCRFYAPKVPER